MSSESIREELLSVISEIREHVGYLQELGVEHSEEALAPRPACLPVDANEFTAAPQPVIAPPAATTQPLQSPASRTTPAQTTPLTAASSQSPSRPPLIESLFGELLP